MDFKNLSYMQLSCVQQDEKVCTMDNRRVMKAYRDRVKEKVLPYPSRAGLFSRVKRYFSGSAIPNNRQHEQTRRPTQVAETAANKSGYILPESSTPANNTMIADQSTNRVLSSFFQEKGDQPLSQIEYEGVMSLLEKSKASITLPLPDSPSEKKKTSGADVSSSSTVQHNHTFAPYSQTTLRNTSMYEGNSTSFATPDYKPVYHTFSDNSRANVSVKRVYQFSGLPSPYRTRIKAPNMVSRKARRIDTVAQSGSNSTLLPSNQTVDSTSTKVMSNTANSLLSILGGNDANEKEQSQEVYRPLHNPYATNKRRFNVEEERVTKKPVLGADDITKTVSYNKSEDLPQSIREESSSSAPISQSAVPRLVPDTLSFSSSNEKAEKSMAEAKSAKEAAPAEETGLESGSPDLSQKGFKSMQTSTESASPMPESKPQQSLFGSNSNGPFLATTNGTKPSFNFGATTKPTSKLEKVKNPSFEPESNAQKPASASNGFSFGAKKDQAPLQSFSFASQSTKPNSTSNDNATSTLKFADTNKPEQPSNGFNSAKAQSSQAPTFSSANGKSVNGSGKRESFEFSFPPVETFTANVDEAQVEQYKLLFEF